MVSHGDSQTAGQKGILSISHTKRQESTIFPESTFLVRAGVRFTPTSEPTCSLLKKNALNFSSIAMFAVRRSLAAE
jgi:hypothetical protein